MRCAANGGSEPEVPDAASAAKVRKWGLPVLPFVILKYMLQYSKELDASFAALADPTRRAVVAFLCEGPATVGDLADQLPMSLSAVGQHLRRLEGAGLIATEKKGRTRICWVEPEKLASIETWFTERRRSNERRLDQLEAFLDRDATE